MKKVLLPLIALITILFSANVNAQTQNSGGEEYKGAIGLKFGAYEDGISGKYFMSDQVSLEGIIGFRSHGAVFTGLYELNQQAFNVSGLNFYYGFGGHIGAVGKGVYRRIGSDQAYNSSHILLGADGVIGLEYVIPQSPIAFSLDLNPRVELATGPFFDLAPGLGIKYVFK